MTHLFTPALVYNFIHKGWLYIFVAIFLTSAWQFYEYVYTLQAPEPNGRK